MSDTYAIQHVLNGCRADIARRNSLIRDHAAMIARLEADNLTDTRHAEVAQRLIDQIDTDASISAWAPSSEVAAAALVTDLASINGLSGSDTIGRMPAENH